MKSTNHTFVICAYKTSSYLEECIKSLKKQTLQSNIILYSSTPSNHIEDLAKSYDIPFYTSKGGGIGKDWNNALSFVKTKYATIAHQDDIYYEDYLKSIMNSLKKNEKSLIAFSDYEEWKNGNTIPPNSNLRIKHLMLKTMSIFPNSKFWRIRVLAFGNPISCPAVTYNLEKLTEFSFDETMRVSLDWLAWYQIGKLSGSFEFIDKKLMFHRIHEESETSNTILDNSRSTEDAMMYRKFWPNFIANFLMKFYVKSQNSNN